MVQITGYPGIYIEEFAPGAPIQGVGTSTAAFIGTAAKGPIQKPTLIQSWDAFVDKFGDILLEAPPSYLAPAVYGFFLNGGTTCYIVRVSTGKNASANLDSLQSGATPPPALIATALQEGSVGDAITVQVNHSSWLAAQLAKAGSTATDLSAASFQTTVPQIQATVSAMAGDRRSITVDNNGGFTAGDKVQLIKGTVTAAAVVQSKSGTNTLTFINPIPGSEDFGTGTVTVRVVTLSEDRKSIQVASNSGFAPGDRVLLTKGTATAQALVQSKSGTSTLVFAAPLPGTEDFGTGTVTVRIADLAIGQKTIRLTIPNGLRLNQALPIGTTVSITRGGTSEIATIAAAGGDTITLEQGLSNNYPVDDNANLPKVASLEFDLIVTDTSTASTETFQWLAMNEQHPNAWKTITSKLITLEAPTAPPVPNPRPAVKTTPLAGGIDDNRATGWNSIKADAAPYLKLLEPYTEVSLVAIPGATDQDVQGKILAHCEKMHDRFAILDAIPGAEPGNGIRDQLGTVIGGGKGFAALYYPWLLVRNPKTGKTEQQPPSGHLAGIYARTDAQRGVHKAPANTNIRGALGLERRLTDEEQAPLNLLGINVLRVFPGQAEPQVWAARTTASDRNWQYINVRRLFLFLEESIEQGIRWGVFEPNNLQLWQKLKRTITEFLTRVWQDGALFGATAKEAFYVRIDEALNPPSTQALGRLYIEVGVRPTYPAEFIVLRIGIWQGGSEVSES